MSKKTLILIALFSLFELTACGESSNNNNSNTYFGNETFFTFDEEQGATAYNSRFNEFHGKIFGASRVDGKVNNALYFGNNLPSYIEFEMSVGIETRAITFLNDQVSVESWIKFESLDDNQRYHFFGDSSSQSFTIEVIDNQFSVRFFNANDELELIRTNFVFGVDTWYHFAFTYDGNQAKTYINGELNNSSSIVAPVNDIYNNLYLGGYRSKTSFPGYIDEFRFDFGLRMEHDINNYYLSFTED